MSDEEFNPKGGKKMLIGILIGVVVAGGGTAGAFLWLGKGPVPAQATKHEEPGPVEKLPSFVVNLRDTGATRYLKATVEMELGSSKDVEKVKKYSAKIRHEVLMYLSNLTVADIQGEGGKQALVSDLLKRVRAAYTGGEVKRLYLTELVVQ